MGAPATLCGVNAKTLPVLLLESPCSLKENLLTDVSLSWNVLGILCWYGEGRGLTEEKLVGASGLAKREVCRDRRLLKGVFDFPDA